MKKLTLQQLAILIDRKLNVDSQHWQPSFKEDTKILIDLGYLDEKGFLSQKGKQLIHQVESKLNVVVPTENVFHPYKAELVKKPILLPEKTESSKEVVTPELIY